MDVLVVLMLTAVFGGSALIDAVLRRRFFRIEDQYEDGYDSGYAAGLEAGKSEAVKAHESGMPVARLCMLQEQVFQLETEPETGNVLECRGILQSFEMEYIGEDIIDTYMADGRRVRSPNHAQLREILATAEIRLLMDPEFQSAE